jgi:MtrB/PioB family decaheme-associated outer membrane protein
MNTCSNRLSVSPIATVVRRILLMLALAPPVLAAEPEDPAVAELTRPQNIVEFGTGYVSGDSYKFGEYNGLQKKGAIGLGNLDIQGGGGYDTESVTRWRLRANDLGLDTRDATFDFREQGKFRINLGYDDFRRNLSDTYQTNFLGAGSRSFALPANWLRPVVAQANPTSLNYRSLSPSVGHASAINASGVLTAPTAAQLAGQDAIIAADTGFQSFNLQSERKRGDLGFGVNLGFHTLLSASVNHETKKGFRPTGAVSSAVQENSVTLPDVIDTTTDQFNLSVEYTRRKGFLRAAYYGSIFKNSVDSISWQDPNDPRRVATMGSAPDNQFHQLNLTGGFSFTPATKLAADLSYGRSRQNQTLLTDASLPVGVPVESADALVVTKAFNLKFTSRLTNRLSVLAHYKFDDRDNRTPVNTFIFYDANLARAAAASPFNAALGLAPNTLGSNVNIMANRPQSKQVNQFDGGADYALGHGQKLAGGYEWQSIERQCDDTWYNCVNAKQSIERTLHGEWRASLFENISATAGYAYSERRVHYDPNAWLALVPMANVVPGAPTVGASTSVYGYLTQSGLTGFGPLAGFPTVPLTGNAAIFSPGNNIVPQSQYGSRDNVTEMPGTRRFNLADRNRDKVRATADWQPTDRFSLQTNFELDSDDYSHSQYGLQKADIWSAGLDGTYAINSRFIISGFYSHESSRSKVAGDGFGSNTNAAFIGRAGNNAVSGGCFATVIDKNSNGKLDPCLNWNADMHDRADTLGVSLVRRGLMGRRLDLTGDVIYTRARTDIGVTGGSYSNSPYALAGAPVLGATVPAIYFISAADFPSVTTRTFELRFTGRFAISASSDMRLIYSYERTKAVDFLYDGLQVGSGTEQLPTNEQAPNYAVHVVGMYYTHRF